MSETTLIVARHGNTFNKGDEILRVGARTDLPLTSEGRAQGRRLGENLLKRSLSPNVYFSASLKRTLEMTEEVISICGVSCSPIVESFLLELDYGDDDGRPESEVLIRLGRIQAEQKFPNDSFSTEELQVIGKETLKEWDTKKILPAGWSFLQERVNSLVPAWRSFANRILHEYKGQTVLAMTSNGIARFAPAILPKNQEQPEGLKLATGAFGIFKYTGNEWSLEEWNVH